MLKKRKADGEKWKKMKKRDTKHRQKHKKTGKKSDEATILPTFTRLLRLSLSLFFLSLTLFFFYSLHILSLSVLSLSRLTLLKTKHFSFHILSHLWSVSFFNLTVVRTFWSIIRTLASVPVDTWMHLPNEMRYISPSLSLPLPVCWFKWPKIQLFSRSLVTTGHHEWCQFAEEEGKKQNIYTCYLYHVE